VLRVWVAMVVLLKIRFEIDDKDAVGAVFAVAMDAL